MKKQQLNKKILVAITFLCVILGLCIIGIVATRPSQSAYAIQKSPEYIELFSDAYFANVKRSFAIADEVFAKFRVEQLSRNIANGLGGLVA